MSVSASDTASLSSWIPIVSDDFLLRHNAGNRSSKLSHGGLFHFFVKRTACVNVMESLGPTTKR